MTGGPTDAEPAWVAILSAGLERAQRHSIVGPGPVSVHVDHARRLGRVLTAPSRALDLGTGAGIPGLVLAGLWPASRWVLLDAAQRRVRLVETLVGELGWTDRVRVVHGRAEELGHDPTHRGRFDLVTARLFGPPAAAAECGAPLLRHGGVLAVTEPPDGSDARWDHAALGQLGLRALPPDPGVQRFVLVAEPEARFPRKAGVPVKRPLF